MLILCVMLLSMQPGVSADVGQFPGDSRIIWTLYFTHKNIVLARLKHL